MHNTKHIFGFALPCSITKGLINLLFLILFFSPALAIAQSEKDATEIRIAKISGNKKVSIEFNNEKEIYNLLVLITDSTGRTVFLDNRYRFKGNYKNTVDFQGEKNGNYKLKVILDEKHMDKNLRIE
jgi:hypothetical protein